MKSIRVAALAAVTLLPAMACTYSASTPAPVGAGGGDFAVQINTQPGCAWQVGAGAAWMDIYSARTGSGAGIIYVYIAPNNGAVRQAYVNVLVSSTCTYFTRSCGGGGSVIAARSLFTEY